MTPAQFFSGAGRTGPLRFLLVGLLAAPFLWALSALAWERGMAMNLLIGAVAGLAAAKLVAEGTRRLHDTGRGGGSGATMLLVLLIGAVAVATYSFELPAAVTLVALAALASGAAALLLRPGQRGANAFGDQPAGWWHTAAAAPAGAMGLAMAAFLVLAGAAAGYGVTWLGRGMEASNAASLRAAAAARNEGGARP